MHQLIPLSRGYIDPGTGSMLFTLLVGLLSTGYFFLKQLIVKLKFTLSAGKADALQTGKLPYVIFSDDKRYWNIFGSICDEFERRGIDIEYWTASPDDPALSVPYKHVKAIFIGEHNKAFARLNMMSATICLATTPGLDVYQWKRSKDVDWYVHTFHTVGTALGYRMFGMDYFDAVLLTGAYQIDEIRTLEEARHLPPKELVIVGSTYMDEMAERIAREGLSSRDPKHRTTVLLAPSWGPNGILRVYGRRIIDALISTGFDVVIRPHPQSKTSDKDVLDELMARYPDGGAVSWNFDNDNFACLSRADVMITDFSGVIFDYALIFDKPVIYTPANYDDAIYDAAWYKKPQWRFTVYPSFGVPLDESQFSNMRNVIERVMADTTLAAGREKARQEVWAHPGASARLTVDYLIQKHESIVATRQGRGERGDKDHG